MKWIDRLFERSARSIALRSSRRGALARIGKTAVGGALLFPVLPFDRTNRLAHAAGGAGGAAGGAQDETKCDYWRYCAFDGFLCSCCGGSATTCPPGTEPSTVAWVGTCRNPRDGRDYVISYNDCCGKSSCGRCFCNTNQGERPGYAMGLFNDINWCMANTGTQMFHCTTALVVGVAGKG
ncbi:MAG: methylamine dehydrogenase light chain, partial [Burkholderiales bacterium]|jgi:methylamine dehydrogenase light chain